MIDRSNGNIVFECDSCTEAIDTETSNWDAAMNLFRRESWRARKDDETGEWKHYCTRCQ